MSSYKSKSLNNNGVCELADSNIDIGNNSLYDGINSKSAILYISFISVLGTIPKKLTLAGGLSTIFFSSSKPAVGLLDEKPPHHTYSRWGKLLAHSIKSLTPLLVCTCPTPST